VGKDKLRRLFWDVHDPYSDEDIYRFLLGEKDIPGLHRETMIARMLLSVRWYDLIDIFGLEKMPLFLGENILKRLWKKEMRRRYQYAREVLQRELSGAL
jgi:hypothetical protein